MPRFVMILDFDSVGKGVFQELLGLLTKRTANGSS